MKQLAILSVAALTFAGCSTVASHSGDVHTHAHAHSSECEHKAVAHAGHMDYLHDGHMHHIHGDHVDEHVIMVSALNPDAETQADPTKHDGHLHAENDGDHAMIPHGDHIDFLHDGHLHHPHGDHVDEHGPLEG